MLTQASRRERLRRALLPPACWHCRTPLAPSSDPATAATCCTDEACMRAEVAYLRQLRALVRGKRTGRQVEIVMDGRLT